MAVKIVNTEGKRKSAVARATTRAGTGVIRINNVILDNMHDNYFKQKIMEPLIIADDKLTKKVDIKVNVIGGGVNGQAEAARLAIARGLVEWSKDQKLQSSYVSYDRTLLVADVRRREPYKPNDSKARAKRQSSKR